MEVRSVKLKKKDTEGKEFTPEIVLWDPVRKRNEKFENCANMVHPDFIKAVARLAAHMVVLWNADTPDNFEQSAFIDEFEARGYSISGREDETRITVKGHRKTTYAGAMTANATLMFNQDMDKPGSYRFLDDLKAKVKVIEVETLGYCFDGRCYEGPQLSLNMPEPPKGTGKKITKAQIAPPEGTIAGIAGQIVDEVNNGKEGKEKGKGTRGRKVAQSASHPSGEAHE